MRNFIALGLLVALTSGCTNRASGWNLEPLARGVSEALDVSVRGLKLEIRAEHKSGTEVVLHCILRNETVEDADVEVDQSTLPWWNADFFQIAAVDANGKVTPRNPWPVVIDHIGPPAEGVSIAAGKSLEGDIKLGAMPIAGLSKDEAVILFWSYTVVGWPRRDDNYYNFQGATFLKAER